jgi:hypothetical protein
VVVGVFPSMSLAAAFTPGTRELLSAVSWRAGFDWRTFETERGLLLRVENAGNSEQVERFL